MNTSVPTTRLGMQNKSERNLMGAQIDGANGVVRTAGLNLRGEQKVAAKS